MDDAIARRRLVNHGITSAGRRRPADVVSWYGAVQAQEYEPAKWGLGLRMDENAIDAQVEEAFTRGQILRTHVMRPTWHFVTSADIRWLLELTAARVHRVMSTYNRQMGLDTALMVRGTKIVERALRDGEHLTRGELGERLQQSKLDLSGSRLAHLTMYAELEGVICSGPRRGKKSTYALLAVRAPNARRLERDEALGELARRYFRSHGPATIRDFVWWSGLKTEDARRGADIVRARRTEIGGLAYRSLDLASSNVDRPGMVHLLPIYDEYLVAYRDRAAVPHGPATFAWGAQKPMMFQHALVIAGQVVGTWRTPSKSRGVAVDAAAMRPLTRRERKDLAAAIERYERFRGVPVALTIRTPSAG
jgi:hypothetical protein